MIPIAGNFIIVTVTTKALPRMMRKRETIHVQYDKVHTTKTTANAGSN